MVAHIFKRSFNTQPPEGGWKLYQLNFTKFGWFQHTAARRRLAYDPQYEWGYELVSTHSRPKAAGFVYDDERAIGEVSTHSRPKAAGIY